MKLGKASPLHAAVFAVAGRLIEDFETNPKLQYRIHMTMTYVWVVMTVVVVSAFFLFPGFWGVVSILYLTVISHYANFATDYGAVSAAEAAGTTPQVPEVLLKRIDAMSRLLLQMHKGSPGLSAEDRAELEQLLAVE